MNTHRLTLYLHPLALILSAYLALGLLYAWATPPLEASDELWHMGMVDFIADTGTLPVQTPDTPTQYEQEGSQPPLYYLIAAALVAPLDRNDFDALRHPNPHAKAGVPAATDNKNLVLHTWTTDAPSGAALAVYALRLFSLALGACTVASVYAVARLLMLDSPRQQLVALVAAALTAFNPMFVFISASVNNDNLATALNSALVWLMLAQWRDGWTTRRAALIALVFALATLSKLSGLALAPALLVLGVAHTLRTRSLRPLVTFGVLLGGVWLIVAGWWYARNVILYGELFGTRTMVAVAGARLEPFTLATLADEFEGFRAAYWGWFGAVNLVAPPAFYRLLDAFTVSALAGLLAGLWRRWRTVAHSDRLRVWLPYALLFVILAGGSLALIAWTAQTYASQGRLLFPFAAAISPLLALGWLTLVGGVVGFVGRVRARPYAAQETLTAWLALLAPLVLFVCAVLLPFTVIAPAYRPPAPLAALPAHARPVYADFGHVRLIGYTADARRYKPGDDLPVTVYWQVVAPTDRDLSLYLHAVDSAGGDVGKIDSYPGGGRLQTTHWQPDAIYADTYRIPLRQDAAGSFRLRVQVGWWHTPTGEVVTARDADGAPLDAVMLDAGGFAGGAEPLPVELVPVERVTFGETIALVGYALDGDRLTLAWEALRAPPADYTVFVQLLDRQGGIAGQGDAPPDLPTQYWQPGERYLTRHTLVYPQLPTGTLTLVVGWYRPDDFARLSAAYPNDAYPLTTITAAR